MSTVERWRMPSGRVATIDLRQAPEAIEDARRLLREFGDAELINEEAPGAGSHQPEGENQNTNTHEGEPIMTMMAEATDIAQQSDLVREWAEAYNACRDAAAVEIQADPRFAEWAAKQIAAGPWTMRDCVHKELENYRQDMPAFPADVLPAWAASCEVGYEAGGEVTILINGRVHERGDAYAQAASILTVTVSGDEDPIGTFRPGDVLIESTELVGLDPADVNSWRVVADTARVLDELASEMQAVTA